MVTVILAAGAVAASATPTPASARDGCGLFFIGAYVGACVPLVMPGTY